MDLGRWLLVLFGQEGVDFGVFGLGEAECGGGDGAFDLFGVAAAYYRCGDGWVVEGPGYGNDAGCDVVAGADLFQQVGYGEVAGEQRLLVVLRVAAEVVFGEGGYTLFGHGSGEEARVHWRVVDDADAVLLAEGQDFGFGGAVEHGVGRLE